IKGVKDLASVIAKVERLVDIKITSGTNPNKMKKEFGRDKGKVGKASKNGKFKLKKDKDATGTDKKDTSQSIVYTTSKGCYLCNGDYCMRDCPKRGKLNSLVAEANDDEEGGSSR
ncbi:UNVERIFIED_CONTAM: hypothetical protein Sindi_2001700, partial [Sesamum indicum]